MEDKRTFLCELMLFASTGPIPEESLLTPSEIND